MLTQVAHKKDVFPIIEKISWECQTSSQTIIDMLLHIFAQEDAPNVKIVFRAATAVLSINDSLADWRLNELMSRLMTDMFKYVKFINFCDCCMLMLMRLAKKNIRVCRFLQGREADYSWLEKYCKIRSEGNHIQGGTAWKPRGRNVQNVGE